MKTVRIKATYIGNNENMGYKKGDQYVIILSVYNNEIAIIAPNDIRYSYPNISVLLNDFSNITKIK